MTSASDDMARRDPKFPSVPFCSSVSRSQNWEPRDLVAPGDQLRQVKTRDRQRAAAKPLQIAQLRIGVSAGLTDAFPCNHRHSSCRQHPNVGCTRGQTSTPHPHRATSANTQTQAMQRLAQSPTQNAKTQVTQSARTSARTQTSGSVQPDLAPGKTVWRRPGYSPM